jgi:hypothetical protein
MFLDSNENDVEIFGFYLFFCSILPQMFIHALFVLGAGPQICIPTLFVLSVNHVSVNRGISESWCQ